MLFFSISSRLIKTSPPLKRLNLLNSAPLSALINGQHRRGLRVIYGDVNKLPSKVQNYLEENVKLCQPDAVHICDGTEKENDLLMYILQKEGILKKLPKYDNW